MRLFLKFLTLMALCSVTAPAYAQFGEVSRERTVALLKKEIANLQKELPMTLGRNIKLTEVEYSERAVKFTYTVGVETIELGVQKVDDMREDVQGRNCANFHTYLEQGIITAIRNEYLRNRTSLGLIETTANTCRIEVQPD